MKGGWHTLALLSMGNTWPQSLVSSERKTWSIRVHIQSMNKTGSIFGVSMEEQDASDWWSGWQWRHREIFHHESRWKHRWRHFWGGGYLACLPYSVKNPKRGLWRAVSETDQAPHGTSYIMRTGRKTGIVDGIKDKLAGEIAVTNLQGKWLECSLLNCVCSATAFSMTGSIGKKRPKSIRTGCWLHLSAASWSCQSVCIPDLLPLSGIWVQAMFRVCSLVTCWCFLTVSVNYILLCQFLPGISQQNGFFFQYFNKYWYAQPNHFQKSLCSPHFVGF